MKRRLLILIFLVAVLLLSSCGTSGVMTHIKAKEAVKIAENLTGLNVNLVSETDITDKKRVFLMACPDGNQFAIISELRKDIVNGEEWGFDRCYITDNYISSIFESKKSDIKDILETYDIYKYVDPDYEKITFFQDVDIASGEGVCAKQIPMIFTGTKEEVCEIIMRLSNAFSEVDRLLSYSYNSNGLCDEAYRFEDYSSGSMGMKVIVRIDIDGKVNNHSYFIYNSLDGSGSLTKMEILEIFEKII